MDNYGFSTLSIYKKVPGVINLFKAGGCLKNLSLNNFRQPPAGRHNYSSATI